MLLIPCPAWILTQIASGTIRQRESVVLPKIYLYHKRGYLAFFTMQYFPLRHFNTPYHCSQAVLMTSTTLTLEQLGASLASDSHLATCWNMLHRSESCALAGIEYDTPPPGWRWTSRCGENFAELELNCKSLALFSPCFSPCRELFVVCLQ